jgi:hypothetical protein
MGLFLFFAIGRIIITEVMSNVRGSESTCGTRNEYVEIYNLSPDTVDLADHWISDFDGNPDEIFPWENDTLLIKYPKVRTHSTRIYPLSYALILDRDYVKWDSVNWQPYDLMDSTLILTTDDHTIGDGLSTNDPLILYATADPCTTSFGTPYLDDGFPSDPGDGISWERIDLDRADSIDNWYPALDPSGGTPGRKNSTADAYDLGLDSASIFFYPARLKPGEDLRTEIRIGNNGLRPAADWTLAIYEDSNRDCLLDPVEFRASLAGVNVAARDSVSLYYDYRKPSAGEHRLAFKIEYAADKDPANDLVFKSFTVSDRIGILSVSPEIFTPNSDNVKDLLQIDYRLPEPGGALTIAVYDCRGKKVHELCSGQTASSVLGTVIWNGTSLGKKVPTGMYVIYLEYQYRNRSVRAKKTAVLAR